MKRNESLGYVVYLTIIAIAVIVGITVVRPDFMAARDLPLHPAIICVLSIVVGIILSALFLELGHLIGARVGKNKVVRWIVLGVGFELKENGKKRAIFKEFDGLTGETYAVPENIESSNPKASIWFGLLGLFIEIIIGVVLVVIGTVKSADGLIWLKIVGEILVTTGIMVMFYDIFPAALDTENDGHLMMILNTKNNREAYNSMILANYLVSKGEEAPAIKVYDDVTDFTSSVNDVTMYKHLVNHNYEGVIEVAQKTIDSQKKVSGGVYTNAVAQKLSAIIMSKPIEEAKEIFINMSMEDKKKISQLNSIQAIRAYVLANGVIEESESETRTGLDNIQGKLRKVLKEHKEIEKKALLEAVEYIHSLHPDWDFTDYSFWTEAHPESTSENPSEE